MPFRAAVSIFLIISRKAASDAAASAVDLSFFCVSTINFLTLVRTELLTALFLILRSSLCRWRFSAELFFLAKRNPQLVKIRWTAFMPLAFVTFGNIFDFSALKEGFHLDFTTAGAEKFLRRA